MLEKSRNFLVANSDLILAIFGGIIGAGLIFYLTKWGPWAFTDSVSYVEAARNLAEGRPFAEIRATGLVIPFDKQPPLYPWLLMSGYKFGISIVNAARWVDILAFGSLVFTVGLFVSRLSNRTWLSIFAMLIVLPSPIMLDAYSGLMTESVFLLLCFLGLVFLFRELTDRNNSWLLIPGILVGCSALTRYAGLAPIATGIIAILLLNSSDLKVRLKQATSFGLISFLPLAIWIVSRFMLSSQLSTPQPPSGNPWELLEPLRIIGTKIVWSWLPILGRFGETSHRLKLIGLILLGSSLLGINLFMYYKSGIGVRSRNLRLSATILLLNTLFHILFMTAVTVIGPWHVRIDPRQLSPIFLFGGLGLLLSMDLGTNSDLRKWGSVAVQGIIVMALFFQNLPELQSLIEEMHSQGRGYTASHWHNSELLTAIEGLPGEVTIISNDIEGLMFHTGISAYRFTEIQEGIALPINEPYGTRLDDPLQQEYAQDCAAIVLFEDEFRLFQEVYGAQASTRLQSIISESYPYFKSEQGGIYFYAEACIEL